MTGAGSYNNGGKGNKIKNKNVRFDSESQSSIQQAKYLRNVVQLPRSSQIADHRNLNNFSSQGLIVNDTDMTYVNV